MIGHNYQMYQSGSKCILSKEENDLHFTGSCLKYKCISDKPDMFDLSSTIITVRVFSQDSSGELDFVDCKTQDEILKFPVHPIEIKCPSFNKICFGYPCKNHGYPKNGKCICQPGYVGVYCEYEDDYKTISIDNKLNYNDIGDIIVNPNQYIFFTPDIKDKFKSEFSITPYEFY